MPLVVCAGSLHRSSILWIRHSFHVRAIPTSNGPDVRFVPDANRRARPRAAANAAALQSTSVVIGCQPKPVCPTTPQAAQTGPSPPLACRHPPARQCCLPPPPPGIHRHACHRKDAHGRPRPLRLRRSDVCLQESSAERPFPLYPVGPSLLVGQALTRVKGVNEPCILRRKPADEVPRPTLTDLAWPSPDQGNATHDREGLPER